MSTLIVSCKTIEPELRKAMEEIGCCYEVRWLESGLHNVPKNLNTRIQEILDESSSYSTILLAMSFCGNSVVGLRTGDFQLVIPRCDDCISLLVGSVKKRTEYFATYFLTEGWLKGERNIWREYEECVKKYGARRAKWIFSAMLANYQNLALLDTGCIMRDALEEEVRKIADKLELQYVSIPGTLDYIKELLSGPWTEERFVTVPPHCTLPESACTLKGGSECSVV